MWTTQTILCSVAALTALTTASQIDPTTNGVNLDSVLFEALFGGAEVGQCTRCLIANCCSNGLKCKADGHDGSCTTCTGQYESPCGNNCCNSGEECHGGSCTIPLQIQEATSGRMLELGERCRSELCFADGNSMKIKWALFYIPKNSPYWWVWWRRWRRRWH